MTWTTTPASPSARPVRGWSAAGPAAAASDPVRGWMSMPYRPVLVDGLGGDGTATIDAVLAAIAAGRGVEAAAAYPAGGGIWDLAGRVDGHGPVLGDLAASAAGLVVAGSHGDVPGVVSATLPGAVVPGRGDLAAALSGGAVAAVASGRGPISAALAAGVVPGAAPWGGGGSVDGGTTITPTVPVSVSVTSSQTVSIPPWCRWIDVVCLGAGGGGAAGAQGFPGGDGNGGPAGAWAAIRWDRGASRDQWNQLQVTIGAGGAGGPQPGGGGGVGGSTIVQARTPAGAVSGATVTGAGGAGGSGQSIGGGVSGAQTGKAPGNYSFQAISAAGGGTNGGVPGGGGRGGGGSFWPATPGSGSTGGRGQAWLVFSM